MAQKTDHTLEEFAPDIARLRLGFVNVFFVGSPHPGTATPWALVDAGPASGAARILEVAAERFGVDARPAAIIVTHGHFDHAGGLEPLLAVFDVPVYAHPLEMPFLTGKADYPPPDWPAGRGTLSRVAPKQPERGVDLGSRVKELPASGDVPGMPGWRWIATPGHSPGHVSLFRAHDRILISGDAIATTEADAVFSTGSQRAALTGPPGAFTIDWERARRSVATLASLKPSVVAAAHGDPMRGDDLPERLIRLSRDFESKSRPRRGRYVREPAVTNEQGVVWVPPAGRPRVPWAAVSGVAAAAVAGTWLVRRFGKNSKFRIQNSDTE